MTLFQINVRETLDCLRFAAFRAWQNRKPVLPVSRIKQVMMVCHFSGRAKPQTGVAEAKCLFARGILR